MPAFRPRNTRLGHVAEGIGLELLRGVAFIAPPYPEDYGIDATVTLAREYDAKRLIAEDIFAVQLKKASVSEIDLEDDQIKWLFDVPLPFYFGSVDVATTTLKLYCDQTILFAERLKSDWKKMTIVFDQPVTEADIEKGIVSLGTPIHTWSAAELESKDCRPAFYKVLKAHTKNSVINRVVRPVGTVFMHKWEVGGLPEATGWYSARPPGVSFEDIDDYVAPFLDAWSDQALKDAKLDSLDDWIAIFIKKRVARMMVDRNHSAATEYLSQPVNNLKRVNLLPENAKLG